MTIRTYRQEDEQQALTLWNAVLWADRVSADFFRERVFLDPNIAEDGLFVAEEDGRVVGLAVAFVRRTDLPWGYEGKKEAQKDIGFLLPVIVAPESYGGEAARGLLAAAETYLRAQGRKTVSVCGYGPLFFPNAVDREQYPQLHQFFLDNGYRPQGVSYSMKCDLTSFRISDVVRDLENRFAEEQIRFRAYRPEDLLAVKRFLLREFPGWISHFAEKIRAKAPGHEIMLAFEGEDVIGYCQYNYYGFTERVGPFAVAAAMRGRNIGQVMVAHLLQRMSEHGLLCAYFCSTGERQLKFYRKNGFEVFRTKTAFAKEIA